MTLWRQVHLWLGLAIGLPLAVACAAGLPVSYWELTDKIASPAFYPTTEKGPVKSWGELSATVLAALPDARLRRVYLPETGGALHVVVFTATGDEELSIHRQSSVLLGKRDASQSLVDRLYQLHTTLLLGDLGQALIWSLAAALILLSMTGIILWIPKRAKILSAVMPRLRRGRRLRDLHLLVGVYTLIPIFLAGATTLVLAWPGETAPAHHRQEVRALTPRQIDAIEQTISTQHRVLKLRSLSSNDGKPFIRGVAQADNTLFEMHFARNGQLLLLQPVSTSSIDGFARQLHTGEVLGSLGRAVFAVAALAPLALWISGLIWWLRKRRSGQGIKNRPGAKPSRSHGF